jgi:DNA-binding MarR family transcriptional regulator
MGAAVNELVGRGLLVRREDPSDRRTVPLVITDEGAELAARARAAVGRLDGEALAVLTPAERSAVHALLHRMLAELNPAALPPTGRHDPASSAIPSPSALPAW